MAKNEIKKLTSIAAIMSNPLRAMTTSRIDLMLSQWQRGQDVRMQWCFKQIEQVTPIFQICINKRISGIIGRRWDIVPIVESAEAEAQAKAVKAALMKSDTYNKDGLTQAIRNLAMFNFRGRSCVKPYFNEDGVMLFKNIDNWYTLSDNGNLYWNPDMNQGISFIDDSWKQLQKLSEDEVCYLTSENPIDIPAFSIYLRQLIGEEKWSEFVERQGIPQVLLTAPDGTSDANLDQFNSRAIDIFLGGSGTLPSGTDVKLLTEGRGQDPFSTFAEHQMKMICLLAVGSTASILGDVGGGLNEGISNLQSDQFNQFITSDCKQISNAMTRCVVKMLVNKIFPGEDALCRFEYIENESTTVEQYMQILKDLNSANIPIDIQEFKRVTKLSFISDEVKDIWKPERSE